MFQPFERGEFKAPQGTNGYNSEVLQQGSCSHTMVVQIGTGMPGSVCKPPSCTDNTCPRNALNPTKLLGGARLGLCESKPPQNPNQAPSCDQPIRTSNARPRRITLCPEPTWLIPGELGFYRSKSPRNLNQI